MKLSAVACRIRSALPSHDAEPIARFLSRSDGDDESPRALLTGGLRIRVPLRIRSRCVKAGQRRQSLQRIFGASDPVSKQL
jgi:hypothetical protein